MRNAVIFAGNKGNQIDAFDLFWCGDSGAVGGCGGVGDWVYTIGLRSAGMVVFDRGAYVSSCFAKCLAGQEGCFILNLGAVAVLFSHKKAPIEGVAGYSPARLLNFHFASARSIHRNRFADFAPQNASERTGEAISTGLC